MNKIYVVLAVVFTFISCNCQKKAAENTTSEKASGQLPKMEYVANTRGFFQKITIENQTVKIGTDRNKPEMGNTVKISDVDMKELQAAFKNVKVSELPTYKDPTQKRFYDGAAIANLKITQDGKEFQTVDFDHGFPPAEIEKLVNKITSFGKTE